MLYSIINKQHSISSIFLSVLILIGTMSGGGGGRVMKGRMGQSVAEDSSISQKDVEQLTQDLETLTQDMTITKNLRQELKETINQLEKEIPKLQHSLKKMKSNHDVSKKNLNLKNYVH